MRILKKNLKKGEITLKPENLDDIWSLSQIIEPGDYVKGKTERKIKIGEGTDRNVKVVRKQFFIAIIVEKASISDNAEMLKVLGTITECPDEVSKGDHHSFNLETNTVFTLVKNKWFKFQLQKLEEASRGKQPNIIMLIFDREEAYFAKLKGEGFTLLAKMKGDVQKKEEKNVSKDNFYKEIKKKLEEYNKDREVDNIIIGSPGFWKENLLKILDEGIKKKIISATVSQANERGIAELIKRDELKKVLEHNRNSQEARMLDKLLENISKDTACYGLEDTKNKVNEGAVGELLISYKFLQEKKEKDSFKELEDVMLACEKMDGTIHIISSEDPGKQLDSLAGIAGILRWKA